MDTTRRYLNGDVHSLGKVNKIVPRKMELPMMVQSRIQVRKNMFGIRSRFFEHMKSYDYKFKSLAAEPKQVIRALRPNSTCRPRSDAPPKPSASGRSLIEKSSSWKLPPNVYRMKDYFEELGKKQMGKLGPYQCFTVEREARTVNNHFAGKPLNEVNEIFYDVPTTLNEMMSKAHNRNKLKFLKNERFEKVKHGATPPPTKYYPQNFVMRAKTSSSKVKVAAMKPLFYYPNTTVPVKEMTFNKDTFFKPPPGRYDPHDVTCKCYLNGMHEKCPGDVIGNGHQYIFNSKIFRLVRPVKPDKKRFTSSSHADDIAVEISRPPREPVSFRLKRSLSCDDATQGRDRELRFNTMIKKKNLFSVKTGRPIGFLSAMPRFKEASELSVKMEKEKSKFLMMDEEKPVCKPMTKKRLEELAAPKNPRSKIILKKFGVFEPLPHDSSHKAKKISITDSSSGMSSVALEVEDEMVGNEAFVYNENAPPAIRRNTDSW